MSDDKYHCTKEAAKYLAISPSKLEKDRLCGRGPDFYQERKGTKVLYTTKALEQYKERIFRNGCGYE